jgi:hypothetical protein
MIFSIGIGGRIIPADAMAEARLFLAQGGELKLASVFISENALSRA